MFSLTDVAPPEVATEEVEIRTTKVPVRGLSGDDFTLLYTRFPEFGQILSGKQDVTLLPINEVRSRAALIACALGKPGDEATEMQILQRFSGDEQQLLMVTAMRLSMPGHIFGPLLNGAVPHDAAPAIEAPATK